MPDYIHQLKNWPEFSWNRELLAPQLAAIHLAQGRLLGRMEGLGLRPRAEAVLQTLTEEVIKTSEIEGEKLSRTQVRSSLAKRLGLEAGALTGSERAVEGVVEMTLDATQNFSNKLTIGRLCSWHAALFPTGRSGLSKIRIGKWRDDSGGPMQVVSGRWGKPKVHFQAPEAARLPEEVKHFLTWLNGKNAIDPVLKAGIAHLWFVTIHPFDDGNGRISRAIADMLLARSEKSGQRFYSMSAQICLERDDYYDMLEASQKGGLDITLWLQWFLSCLGRAFAGTEKTLLLVLRKARFWEAYSGQEFNGRQRKIINRLLDGFAGNLTSSRWANLGKCSQDTANRDIKNLLKRSILIQNVGGGRSTSYALAEGDWSAPKIA